MRNFTKSLGSIADIEKAYANELVPCQDGTMADSEIGCVEAPVGIVSSDTNMTEFLLQASTVLMSIVMAISVIVLIWAGVKYVTAMGDNYKIDKSKKMIMWSLIGLAVAFWARIIVKTVLLGV